MQPDGLAANPINGMVIAYYCLSEGTEKKVTDDVFFNNRLVNAAHM